MDKLERELAIAEALEGLGEIYVRMGTLLKTSYANMSFDELATMVELSATCTESLSKATVLLATKP